MTHRQCWDALEFMDHMDGGVLSYELKIIKPNPAIYQALLDQYGLKPEECVFIDDTLKNIIAANELGFYGIHAIDHETVLKELEKLGIPAYNR